MNEPFYVTTPIYYVNARPHIGHVYTTMIADVIARYHRLLGQEVFFLTGTDEHGGKVAEAAKAEGISPQQYTDMIAGEFERTFERYRITHNDFIRTTQPRHESCVQRYVQQLLDSGDVYLGEYEGWYDHGQEEYITETNARAQDYKSAISGKPLTKVKEKNYFFRLSKYESRLLEHIEKHPEFIQPAARRNEVLGRIRDGLNDIAVSRSTEPWGVPMPGDPSHSIYVWIDALINYLSAIESRDRADLWPADLHLIGKEILWFHAVIWPAMLMALDKPIYHRLYAHSHWISEGQKMSKSLGNFIDLPELDAYVEAFGLDALRYFLATQGPMAATDADFARQRFIEVYNSDLANTFGNSCSRVTNMIGKYFEGMVPETSGDDALFGKTQRFSDVMRAFATCYGEDNAALNLSSSANRGLEVVRLVDSTIDLEAPFKLVKDPVNLPKVGNILYNCLEALRIASLLLWPFIPDACELFWERIGCDYAAQMKKDGGKGKLAEWVQWGQLQPGTRVEKGAPLFPRYQVK